MTKTQNAVKSAEHLVAAVMRLMDKNIPVLVFWEHKGQLKNLGTSAMSKWFADLDDIVKTNLTNQMVLDLQSLIEGNEELLDNNENVPDKVKASCVYKSVTNPVHPSGVPLLPFPLSLMNKKEKCKFLCDVIRSEAKEKKVKFQYGEESCKPSFWLEQVWSWKNLKESLFLVTEKSFTGRGTWMEFLSETIKAAFDATNLDPEFHVEHLELKSVKMKQKKKLRGIHDVPSVVTNEETAAEELDAYVSVLNAPEFVSLTVGEEFDVEDDVLAPLSQEKPVKANEEHMRVNQDLEVNQDHDGLNQAPENGEQDLERVNQDLVKVDELGDGVNLDTKFVNQESGLEKVAPGPEEGNSSSHSGGVNIKSARGKVFIPRRGIGKSPFKEPSQQHVAKPCRIPMKSCSLSRYLAVPDQVKEQVGGYKQEYNTGGGSCLYKACASHISEFGLVSVDLDYKELRKYTNQKLVEWWDSFSTYFYWPMQVTIGTGDNSVTKTIQDPEEYFTFLKSNESLDSYSESGVDMWILSYVMNTTISALTYNLPVGRGFEGGRFEWNFFTGQGIMKDGSKFSCSAEPLYLLNEHLSHWTRLVPSFVTQSSSRVAAETRDAPVEVFDEILCEAVGVRLPSTESRAKQKRIRGKKKLTKSDGKKHEEVETINKVKKKKNIKTGGPVMKRSRLNDSEKDVAGKQSKVQNPSQNKDQSRSRRSQIKLDRKKYDAGASDLGGQSENVFKEFYVGDTIMEYESAASGIIAKKSDLYFVFPFKEISLEDLLRIPTSEESAEEERINSLCISLKERYELIEERKALLETEMKEVDESIAGIKHREELRNLRRKENKSRRNQIESQLDIESIKQLCQNNKKYFWEILNRECYSERHEDFLSNGKRRDDLRFKSISSPFTDEQIEVVVQDLEHVMLGSFYTGSTVNEFLEKVMLPEALIKVYMDVFNVGKGEAEMMIEETPLHAIDLGSGDESE